MRQHEHRATSSTIEALRRLRTPWAGYRVTSEALVVALADGGAVRITVEGREVEPNLEAFRLGAAMEESGPAGLSAAGDFDAGGNDVVIFRSETWIEETPAAGNGDIRPDAVTQFTGSPLHRSETAVAACTVDDALVIATTAGTGLLVRCGLKPYTVEVTTDRVAIARFLAERHYAAAEGEQGEAPA